MVLEASVKIAAYLNPCSSSCVILRRHPKDASASPRANPLWPKRKGRKSGTRGDGDLDQITECVLTCATKPETSATIFCELILSPPPPPSPRLSIRGNAGSQGWCFYGRARCLWGGPSDESRLLMTIPVFRPQWGRRIIGANQNLHEAWRIIIRIQMSWNVWSRRFHATCRKAGMCQNLPTQDSAREGPMVDDLRAKVRSWTRSAACMQRFDCLVLLLLPLGTGSCFLVFHVC